MGAAEAWLLPALVCMTVMTPMVLKTRNLCVGESAQECGLQAKTVLQQAPALVLMVIVLYIWFVVDTLSRWSKRDKVAARDGRKSSWPWWLRDQDLSWCGVPIYDPTPDKHCTANESGGYVLVRAAYLEGLLEDREKRYSLVCQVATLTRTVSHLTSQLDCCKRKLADAKCTVVSLTAQLYTSGQDNQKLSVELTAAQQQTSGLRGKLQRVTAMFTAIRSALHNREEQLQEVKTNLATTQQELTECKTNLATTQEELADCKASLATTQEELSKCNASRDEAEGHIEQQNVHIKALEEDKASLTTIVEDERKEKTALQAANTAHEARASERDALINTLTGNNTTLQAACGSFQAELGATKQELAKVQRSDKANAAALKASREENQGLRKKMQDMEEELHWYNGRVQILEDAPERLQERLEKALRDGRETTRKHDISVASHKTTKEELCAALKEKQKEQREKQLLQEKHDKLLVKHSKLQEQFTQLQEQHGTQLQQHDTLLQQHREVCDSSAAKDVQLVAVNLEVGETRLALRSEQQSHAATTATCAKLQACNKRKTKQLAAGRRDLRLSRQRMAAAATRAARQLAQAQEDTATATQELTAKCISERAGRVAAEAKADACKGELVMAQQQEDNLEWQVAGQLALREIQPQRPLSAQEFERLAGFLQQQGMSLQDLAAAAVVEADSEQQPQQLELLLLQPQDAQLESLLHHDQQQQQQQQQKPQQLRRTWVDAAAVAAGDQQQQAALSPIPEEPAQTADAADAADTAALEAADGAADDAELISLALLASQPSPDAAATAAAGAAEDGSASSAPGSVDACGADAAAAPEAVAGSVPGAMAPVAALMQEGEGV